MATSANASRLFWPPDSNAIGLSARSPLIPKEPNWWRYSSSLRPSEHKKQLIPCYTMLWNVSMHTYRDSFIMVPTAYDFFFSASSTILSTVRTSPISWKCRHFVVKTKQSKSWQFPGIEPNAYFYIRGFWGALVARWSVAVQARSPRFAQLTTFLFHVMCLFSLHSVTWWFSSPGNLDWISSSDVVSITSWSTWCCVKWAILRFLGWGMIYAAQNFTQNVHFKTRKFLLHCE